jgi:hypothetical protein
MLASGWFPRRGSRRIVEGGTGVLRVDNNEVAKQTIPHAIPLLLTLRACRKLSVRAGMHIGLRHVSSPRHVERCVEISPYTLSGLLRIIAYATNLAGRLSAGSTNAIAVEQTSA